MKIGILVVARIDEVEADWKVVTKLFYDGRAEEAFWLVEDEVEQRHLKEGGAEAEQEVIFFGHTAERQLHRGLLVRWAVGQLQCLP